MSTESLNRFMVSLFIILAVVIQTGTVYAGTEAHGGATVVCRNPQGKILSAELFDLWEGKAPQPCGPNQKIELNQASVEEQIQKALSRLKLQDPALAKQVQEAVKQAQKNFQDKMPHGYGLADLHDLDARCRPRFSSGCNVEYMAHYVDDALFVDPEIYKELKETNRAAFFVHEALNRVLHLDPMAPKSSKLARQKTAFLFSDEPVRMQFSLKGQAQLCLIGCQPVEISGEFTLPVSDRDVLLEQIQLRFEFRDSPWGDKAGYLSSDGPMPLAEAKEGWEFLSKDRTGKVTGSYFLSISTKIEESARETIVGVMFGDEVQLAITPICQDLKTLLQGESAQCGEGLRVPGLRWARSTRFDLFPFYRFHQDGTYTITRIK